jgi:DNA-binding NarL/FixJ family response regulator
MLRALRSTLRVIVLTEAVDREALVAYVRAGAVGCLAVDRAVPELVRAIKQVYAGEVLFDPGTLVDLLTGAAQRPLVQTLAPRELEVLRVLATGLSTEEAASQLRITVHTLRTHLKKAMTKLGARSKLEAIILALREGLVELPR